MSTRLGATALLATTFHDVFMASFVDTHHEGAKSRSPLSPRELQVVSTTFRTFVGGSLIGSQAAASSGNGLSSVSIAR